ncbi:MAG: LysR family transcriptional regulator [Opitutaceae bacterium]|nr:LysR family transcriptional regulator [Cephaloticoccus sp.]MCP5529306.1 LysR family transcriptional regulator [Opitutaceae bacterium]
MELRHLRYFAAVAENLNFRRAAETLRVSQPALSSQVRLLEAEIGVKLLDRSTHHVVLTPAGRRFLVRARHLLRDADDAVRASQREAEGETGEITLGFVSSLTYHLLPLLLRAFRRRMPRVELRLMEMDTDHQIEALVKHRIDLGFIGLGLTRETDELRLVQVAEEQLVAVLPEDHPLPRGRAAALNLRDLAQTPLYLAARESAPLYNPWVVVLCQRAGFQPNVVLEAGQPATAMSYAAAGMGMTILPAQYARLQPPGVRFVPLAKPVPRYRYFAAWSKHNLHPSLARFVEIARATAAAGAHPAKKTRR